MARLKFRFEAERKGWMPQLARLLKKQGYSSKVSEETLEVEGSGLETAARIASIAEIAYEGSASFWKEGNGFVVRLRRP